MKPTFLSVMRITAAALVAAGMSLSTFAQDSTAKDDIKEAGHATKQAAKKTGSATKKGAKKAASKTAGTVEKGAKKVKEKTE